MKKFAPVIIFSLLIVLITVSCSKGGTVTDDGDGIHTPTPSDTTKPVLDIYTPAAAQVFSNGSIISITGKVEDDYGLYRGSVRIYNDANGLLLKEQLYEIHGQKAYNFNVSHTVSTTLAADYTVTVSYEDHGYNTVTKSVKVKANP